MADLRHSNRPGEIGARAATNSVAVTSALRESRRRFEGAGLSSLSTMRSRLAGALHLSSKAGVTVDGTRVQFFAVSSLSPTVKFARVSSIAQESPARALRGPFAGRTAKRG